MIGNRVFAIKGDINEMEYLLQQSTIEPAEALEALESIKKGIFLLEEILNEFREFVKATQLEHRGDRPQRACARGNGRRFPKRSRDRVSSSSWPATCRRSRPTRRSSSAASAS